MLSLLVGAAAVSAQQATPQPFPTPSTPNRTTQTPTRPTAPPGPGAQPPVTQPPARQPAPAAPAPASGPVAVPAPQIETAPSEATLGHPIYPQAQFLASYNAGQGQRYYLFGTTATYTQVTAFYRGALKQRGEIVFDEPQTMMFETGRYREETMAFPPGVTVKDYTWNNSAGYINPKRGVQPERFPTVIQIVPAPGGGQQ